MKLLADKIIFLTGGSTGIGLACAKAYATAGASVVVAAFPSETLASAMQTLGDKHLGLSCDVSKAGDVKRAIRETLLKYGRIDAIHNNVGITNPSKPLHQTTNEEYDQLMNVNVKSVLYTTRYGVESLMKTKGTILNTSSLVADIGQENHAVYTASKGAINALTKSMALDYAPYGIRVNAISPAGVWTPMLREWAKQQPNSMEIAQYLDNIHPIAPCPEPDVIADACVFLFSAKARFITGTILPVSGGAELGYRALRQLR